MVKKHIIMGAAAAGIGAAHKLRMLDPQAEIICISDEIEDPYNKCLLADYLADKKTAKNVHITTAQALKEKNITPLFGTRVIALDTQQKTVTLADKSCLPYDTLCIATGCSPHMIAVPGLANQDNVFTFYSLADSNRIDVYLKEYAPKRAVVVGAGLSGLECADTLRTRGLAVTVVEKGNQVLARHADADASQCIERHMNNAGVEFVSKDHVVGVESSASRVAQVYLANGSVLPTDILICAVGLNPNSALAQQAGIAVKDGSIITDKFLRTSAPGVYAAGDVALVRAYQSDLLVRSSTWPDAMLQGMVAAHGMAGITREYPGIIPIASSAFFGVKFAACAPLIESDLSQQHSKKENESYQKLVIADQKLCGFIQVGPSLSLNQIRRALLTGQQIDDPSLFFVP